MNILQSVPSDFIRCSKKRKSLFQVCDKNKWPHFPILKAIVFFFRAGIFISLRLPTKSKLVRRKKFNFGSYISLMLTLVKIGFKKTLPGWLRENQAKLCVE